MRLTILVIALLVVSSLATAGSLNPSHVPSAPILPPTVPAYVGRVCIVPGDSTDCPQTLPPIAADSTGHLVISINILGSTNFTAFGISVRWNLMRMNATTTDFTNSILSSPIVRANCVNNSGTGCGTHDGPGVATLALAGPNVTAPASGRLFKISLSGSPGVDPQIGFATGCLTVNIGALFAHGSVPNSDLCLVVGSIVTTICTTLCIQDLVPVPEGIQSQSLGTHLPTALASLGGNIVSQLSSGGAPNNATTFVMPYSVTLPGNITGWKAQFEGLRTPVGMQIKVLRKTSTSILTVVETGPIHNPTPVLFTRLPGYPHVVTESTVIPIYTDSLMTVLPGDIIGLTIISDPALGSFDYPLVNATATRFVTRSVNLNGTIDLSDAFTGTLPGTAPALEVSIQPSPATQDTAGDGIPDFVALSPEMRALGADPCRKTVLVQIDYMVSPDGIHTFRPLQQALDNVTGAFDSAPVQSISPCPYQGYPRKANGINLVFDVRNVIPYQSVTDFIHSEPLSFDAIKAAYFDVNRVHYFHYGLFVNLTDSNKRSGIGEIFGSNFIVSLGGWHNKVGNLNEQTGTLMHELGHNLGLDHGGADSINRKPNYLSVMSYEHQVVGITSQTPAGDVTRFDYSREALPTLNESNLSDWAVLSNTNIYTKWVCPDHHTVKMDLLSHTLNWGCDPGLRSGVSNDVNNDTVRGLLTGYNDWANLQFNFVQSSNFNTGCASACDIGCASACDIGCASGCDIGCRVCDFGVELDFNTAVTIEASWAALFASPHRSTATSVSCTPSPVVVNTPSACTATVTDAGTGSPLNVTGIVSFLSSQAGSFAPSTCSIVSTGVTASCTVSYTPDISSLGSQMITSGYTGDTNHLSSSGSASVNGISLPSITLTTNTTLTNDLTGRIVIASDNLVLNCNGHTISGITTDPLTGTYPGILLNGRSRVTVKNCLVTNFYIGVQTVSSTRDLLIHNKASNNGYGFLLSSSNFNALLFNTANGNLHDGFRLESSNRNVIAGNRANNNLGSGFLLVSSPRNILLLNTANGNGAYGFALTSSSNNNQVMWNSACGNGIFDAYQDAASTGNVYKGNEFCTTQGLPPRF